MQSLQGQQYSPFRNGLKSSTHYPFSKRNVSIMGSVSATPQERVLRTHLTANGQFGTPGKVVSDLGWKYGHTKQLTLYLTSLRCTVQYIVVELSS